MFDREIDVAEIMREIKKKASAYEGDMVNVPEWNCGDSNISAQLMDIYNEGKRINEFTENTRVFSEQYMEMGRSIPVSSRYSGFFRKLLILYKRFIRKSTRFLALDQKVYNEKVNECIKANTEYQQEMLKLVTVVNQICRENEELKQQMNQLQMGSKGLQIENEELKQQMNQLQMNLKGLGNENTYDMDDKIYLNFENQFRGSEDEIKKRMWFYVDNYIKKTIRDMENEKIVDLGCGRGEWLKILQVEGYKCSGIDMNKSMVDVCLEKGLDVQCGDAIQYLKSLKSESVKVISGFQIAEHISLGELTELIREAYRVLSYHGILILETLNCKNLEVGSASFYLDPTHKRPVHQEYLCFLARENGFYETEIALWKNAETEQWLDSVIAQDGTKAMESPVIRTIFETLKSNVYVSPDYALIATK